MNAKPNVKVAFFIYVVMPDCTADWLGRGVVFGPFSRGGDELLGAAG